MTTLQAIRALNAALVFGMNGLAIAQRFGHVIEQAQAENREIKESEWQGIVSAADRADEALATAIEEAAV